MPNSMTLATLLHFCFEIGSRIAPVDLELDIYLYIHKHTYIHMLMHKQINIYQRLELIIPLGLLLHACLPQLLFSEPWCP